MEISLTTPALLFPTISLLMLAYTNRFVAIGSRIRNLHGLYQQEKSDHLLEQINILRIRIRLIRDLQVIGIACLFFSVLSMFLIFENLTDWAKYSFATSLLLLLIAFSLSGWEIVLSTRALNIQLRDVEERELDFFERNKKYNLLITLFQLKRSFDKLNFKYQVLAVYILLNFCIITLFIFIEIMDKILSLGC